ncbi:dihydroorotase [Candidatus Kinetoplastidibacterium crithidiae]|uniref:Dihydroorotase n=1 Tax=Candidatus Kinetoplastidibacterium crithidiae TCC036E TaxID=1208918 RepID=M1LXC8_9PROT|nr:dihydroorotase [Candidatus Kinetoplastibacterium crithidii]AFZ82480.1 dihydroorotase [Candidatus Kinetoplastibacterium crithidii (ex Angomonas deanei ATCC 30255)]AGF47859.1 dihydroorotase [Candidatus Kinetoplastibacterium crithidii TCC036E]
MDKLVDSIIITKPDDWHVHFRDGEMLDAVIFDTVKQFSRAIIMPNLSEPITTTNMAKNYRHRILDSLARLKKNNQISKESSFTPLMTLYLTDNTKPEEVLNAHSSGFVFAFKLYPAASTTNSTAGVSNLFENCREVLEKLQYIGMPLLIHAELPDKNIDIFDRERFFIDKIMTPLRRDFPDIKLVFEHVSTKEGVDFVMEDTGPIAATVTPQHLIYNRNSLFSGGLNPHLYCLPILKAEEHRKAILKAVFSGSARFFLGTDSAPHIRSLKENRCGCAGCYNAYNAMALYASIFDENNSLDKLEAFASFNGPDFYGLPRNRDFFVLHRKENIIPDMLEIGKIQLIPLGAGSTINWCI